MKKMILLLLMSFSIGLTYPVEATAAPPPIDQDELHYVDKVIIASMFINDDVIVIDCDNDQSAVMSHYSYDFTVNSTKADAGPLLVPLYTEPEIIGEDPGWNTNRHNNQITGLEANPYLLYQQNLVNKVSYNRLE